MSNNNKKYSHKEETGIRLVEPEPVPAPVEVIPESLKPQPVIASGNGPVHQNAYQCRFIGTDGSRWSSGELVITREWSAPIAMITPAIQGAVAARIIEYRLVTNQVR